MVLLPVVLVAMVFATGAAQRTDFARLGLDLFLLGPAAGVAVGLVSLATLEMVRRRVGVRRDYESLYSLGVAFAAYAAAESVHGSGFLAAFAAGLTIAAFDVELCECFKEYGETTAELALLLTFVLLGSSLIWTGVGEASLASLAFAVLVLLGRPLVLPRARRRTRRPHEPAPRRLVRAARALVAPARAAAGLRRDTGERGALPRHLPRRAALGALSTAAPLAWRAAGSPRPRTRSRAPC